MIEYTHKEYQPITRMLSKAFLRPWETPEAEAAQLLLGHGTKVSSLRQTRFGQLRLGEATWESPGCGDLPKGLDARLLYWVTPWAQKFRRPMSLAQRVERRLGFGRLIAEFRRLVRVMDETGWVGPPVPGILLVDGQRNAFVFTDGNRRIGIAATVGILSIPVRIDPKLTFTWAQTLQAGRSRFSDADSRRIWEHVWERVDGKA